MKTKLIFVMALFHVVGAFGQLPQVVRNWATTNPPGAYINTDILSQKAITVAGLTNMGGPLRLSNSVVSIIPTLLRGAILGGTNQWQYTNLTGNSTITLNSLLDGVTYRLSVSNGADYTLTWETGLYWVNHPGVPAIAATNGISEYFIWRDPIVAGKTNISDTGYDLVLAPGANITLTTNNDHTITISSSGTGGGGLNYLFNPTQMFTNTGGNVDIKAGVPLTNAFLRGSGAAPFGTIVTNGIISLTPHLVQDAIFDGGNYNWGFTNIGANTSIILSNLQVGVQYTLSVSNGGEFTLTFNMGVNDWIYHPGTAGVATTNGLTDYIFWRDPAISTKTNIADIGPSIIFAPGANITFTTNRNTVTIAGGAGGGAGTVTSVGLTVPSIFGTNGGNVTASGLVSFTNVWQVANFFWAGPTSGSKAEPAFRALVNGDLPTAISLVSGVFSGAMSVGSLANTGTTTNTGAINNAGPLTNWNSVTMQKTLGFSTNLVRDGIFDGGAYQFGYTNIAANYSIILSNLTKGVRYTLSVSNPGIFTVSFNVLANDWITHPGTAGVATTNGITEYSFWIDPSLTKTNIYERTPGITFTPGTSITFTTNAQYSVAINSGGGGGGTVTSVGLTVPSIFGTNGGNITGSGQLSYTNVFQAVNFVWAGPTSGGKAEPAFRALVNSDLPTAISLASGIFSGALSAGSFANTGTTTNTGAINNAGPETNWNTVTAQKTIALTPHLVNDAIFDGGAYQWGYTNIGANYSVILSNLTVGVQYTLSVSNGGEFTVTFNMGVNDWIFHPGTAGVATTNGITDFIFWRDPAINTKTNIADIGRTLSLAAGANITFTTNGYVVTIAGSAGGGAGTVTSVGLAVPSVFGTNGGNVATSGLLSFTNVFQTANFVFAGPTSGGKAEPAYRALVNGDLPTAISLASGIFSGALSAGSFANTGTFTNTGAANLAAPLTNWSSVTSYKTTQLVPALLSAGTIFDGGSYQWAYTNIVGNTTVTISNLLPGVVYTLSVSNPGISTVTFNVLGNDWITHPGTAGVATTNGMTDFVFWKDPSGLAKTNIQEIGVGLTYTNGNYIVLTTNTQSTIAIALATNANLGYLSVSNAGAYSTNFIEGKLGPALIFGHESNGIVWASISNSAAKFYGSYVIFTQTADGTSNTNLNLSASAAATNTWTGTGSGSRTLPANFFIVGRRLDAEFEGDYWSSASGNCRIMAMLNTSSATNIAAQVLAAPPASVTGNGDFFRVHTETTCRSVGVSGTVSTSGSIDFQKAGVPTSIHFTNLVLTVDTTAALTYDIMSTNGGQVYSFLTRGGGLQFR